MPRALALAAVALACAACAPMNESAAPDADARSLAAAETAFAAHSVREDMRGAFLAHFADDAMFVRRGWVLARPALEARPAPPIVLDWRPVHTEVAASGELGLSTGPWKLVEKGKPESPLYGQYVSIWRREAGGPWKVIVDLGIGHPGPSFWPDALEALPASREARASGDVREAEAAFARVSAKEGLAAAYARFASPRMRLYRDGHAPSVGGGYAAALPAAGKTFAWTVEQSQASRSGDFAYARGHYASEAPGPAALGYFLRVWRPEKGEWRIVMDVVQDAS